MSELLLVGSSHKTAPLAVRERLSLTGSRVAGFLAELRERAVIHEAVVLSTCNRTELYLVVGDPVAAESAVLGALAGRAGIRPTELVDGLFTERNCDAARHLFRVVAGLESMVVGETEVQGQVKRAYEQALSERTTGPLTNRMFRAGARGRQARAARRRRSPRAHASVASVAVDAAREALGELGDRRVVIIGAGETAEGCAPGRCTSRAWARCSSRTAAASARSRWRAASAGARSPSTICRRRSRRPTSSSPRPPRRTRSSTRRSSPR